MIFAKNKTLQEEIVEIILSHEPISGKKIKSILDSEGKHFSIQSIYRQIKILIENRVVWKDKLYYKIHSEWRIKLESVIGKYNLYYSPKPGDRSTHSVKTLKEIEILFKDIIFNLYKNNPQSSLFSYGYHYFFSLIKHKVTNQSFFRKGHIRDKRYGFYVTLGNDDLDIYTKKKFSNEFYKIEISDKKYKHRNIHKAIIGPYILHIIFTEKTEREIDAIYKSNKTISEKIDALQAIMEKKEKCKIIIQNNLKEALKIKTKIAETFILPERVKRELKEEKEKLKNLTTN